LFSLQHPHSVTVNFSWPCAKMKTIRFYISLTNQLNDYWHTEKSEPAKKFPAFYEISWLPCVRKNTPLGSVIGQLNPAPSHTVLLRLFLILSSHARLGLRCGFLSPVRFVLAKKSCFPWRLFRLVARWEFADGTQFV
jgi:hypothetical protein